MSTKGELPKRIVTGYLFAGVVIGSALTLGGLRLAGIPLQLGLTTPAFHKFFSAYEDLKTQYYKDIPEQTLLDGAVQGMIKSVDDPFTDYFTPTGVEQFQNLLSGSFDGIGVVLVQHGAIFQIQSVVSGSPAEKAGLKPHDVIESINGRDVKGLSFDQLSGLILGPPGTSVTITVQRMINGPQTFTFHVARAKISRPTVYSKMLSNHIGYLQISVIGDTTAKEVAAAYYSLQAKGAEKLIIDLRGNPGGYLDQAVSIAGNFIPKGERVLSTVTRDGTKAVYTSPGPGTKLPIAVLMDQNTASAAEVLSAALHDDDHAALVGTRSFGKGTVQVTQMYSDGSGIKYTIAKWLTPSGFWVNHVGLKPTVLVQLPNYTNLPSVQDAKLPLEFNQNNADVSTLQKYLQALGYQVDRTDGFFDESTRSAVEAFQKSSSLPITGVVDVMTAAGLQTALDQKISESDTQLTRAEQVVMSEH